MNTVKNLFAGLLFLIILLFCVSTSRGEITFQEVTSSVGVTHVGESWGLSWGDFNGDGFADLWASNHSSKPSLYLNNGGTSGTVTTNGLIAYYAFEDKSGLVVSDLSANGNDGTINGGIAWTTGANESGGGLIFNGVDTYVNIGDIDLADAFTITAWIKISTLDKITIMGKSFQTYQFYVSAVGSLVFQRNSGTSISYNAGLVPDTWYHVAVTFDTTNGMFLYLNGSLVGTNGDILITNQSNDITKIGATGFIAKNLFSGVIDEIRIYTRALTATEVKNLISTGQATFSNIIDQVWSANSSDDTHGSEWIDYDNDGDQDLSEQVGDPNYLGHHMFVNDAGKLTDQAESLGIVNTDTYGRTPLWFDYDNDGLLDSFLTAKVAGNTRYSTLYRNTANGFLNVNDTVGLSLSKSYYGAQLADMNGDSILDLIPTRYTYPDLVYDTTTIPFTEIGSTLGIPTTYNVNDRVIVDFNNDVLPDIYEVTDTEFSEVVQQSGTKVEMALIPSSTEEHGITFSATGNNLSFKIFRQHYKDPFIFIGADGHQPSDYTVTGRDRGTFSVSLNDSSNNGMKNHAKGTKGLYIGFNTTKQLWELLNVSSGSICLEISMESDGSISNVTPVGFVQTEAGINNKLLMNNGAGFDDKTAERGLNDHFFPQSVVAGDFDNDMDVDLYVVNSTRLTNPSNKLYENMGDGTFLPVANSGGAAGSDAGRGDCVATADYDNDGFLDLAVVNGNEFGIFSDDGPDQLFHNTGNGNNWIEIDLEGTLSNRDGIGAIIYATAGGVMQMREQNGGMHNRTQNHKRIHFGMGSNTVIDTLEVHWPSGIVQTLTDVNVNQILQVTEPNESLSQNLLAHYAFEEANGTIAIDSSGKGNDGIINGGAVRTTGANGNGGGLEFNGVNAYVDVGDIDLTDAFTMAAWIKPSILGNKSAIIGKSYDAYQFFLSTSDNFLFQSNQSTQINYNAGLIVNTWYHVAVTFNTTDGMKLYVDGSLVNANSTASIMGTNDVVTKIGATTATPKNFFSGVIDEVRIYDRAITLLEVNSLANK